MEFKGIWYKETNCLNSFMPSSLNLGMNQFRILFYMSCTKRPRNGDIMMFTSYDNYKHKWSRFFGKVDLDTKAFAFKKFTLLKTLLITFFYGPMPFNVSFRRQSKDCFLNLFRTKWMRGAKEKNKNIWLYRIWTLSELYERKYQRKHKWSKYIKQKMHSRRVIIYEHNYLFGIIIIIADH